MSSKGRVTIITFGSSTHGYGHLSRTRYLSEHLRNNLLEVEKVQNINPFDEKGVKLFPGEPAYEEFIISTISLISKEKREGTIIIDLPFTDLLISTINSRLVKKASRKTIALDFFDYGSQVLDAIINLFNHRYAGKNECALFSGLEYSIIREEFRPYRRTEYLHEHGRPLNVLISCGGTDPTNRTAVGLDFCQSIHEKGNELEVTVISNNQVVKKYDFTFNHLAFSPHFPAMLSKADFAIVSGGTTALESCFVGTPIITLPQNDEERVFFEWLESIGLGVCHDSLMLDRILDPHDRASISRRQRERVDHLGAARILKIIRGLAT